MDVNTNVSDQLRLCNALNKCKYKPFEQETIIYKSVVTDLFYQYIHTTSPWFHIHTYGFSHSLNIISSYQTVHMFRFASSYSLASNTSPSSCKSNSVIWKKKSQETRSSDENLRKPNGHAYKQSVQIITNSIVNDS